MHVQQSRHSLNSSLHPQRGSALADVLEAILVFLFRWTGGGGEGAQQAPTVMRKRASDLKRLLTN